MELGRSCVDAAYRNRAAMQLLWRGIAAYVFHYQIDLMFGCASLPGTDPDAAGDGTHLSLPEPPRAAGGAAARPAAPLRGDAAAAGPTTIDPRRALAQLPPLIKGYLRLGRLRRRRRGDRPPVQHHGRRRGGEDRPGDRQILPPLRAAIARGAGLAAARADQRLPLPLRLGRAGRGEGFVRPATPSSPLLARSRGGVACASAP